MHGDRWLARLEELERASAEVEDLLRKIVAELEGPRQPRTRRGLASGREARRGPALVLIQGGRSRE